MTDATARDWAVRDYRAHLLAVAKRAELPTTAPRVLTERIARRFLRAVRGWLATATGP
ncbi:hypothetical protein [Nonomuraea sp. SYSU D8015]|uniref:hypothetical protein n=1 Tax=Nonomuraea sp. SYSU D8015 TaxID=2593644 RepID=UPI0016605B40|nr:hypothetical protein [Nonomuraea sp. SYSU D8015]